MSKESFLLKYTPELDGLRGVAIVGVMVFHAGAPFLKGGFIGVDIFFVLSGFLITSLLVSEFNRCGTVNLKNFYIRRMLRLAPALIVLLLVLCLASFFFLSSQEANSNYIDSLIALAYLSNWARAFSIHPPYLLGHTWSLSIEEQFYIIWPVLLLIVLRLFKTRHSVVMFAIAVAIVSWVFRIYLHANGATVERLYYGLDTRVDALMVGCALGVALASGHLTSGSRKEALSRVLVVIAPVSVACLLVFSTVADHHAPYMYQYGFFSIELLTAILIMDVLLNDNSMIRRLLGMKWLVWIGTLSYGLYLWHYPIYKLMFVFGFRGVAVVIAGSLTTFALTVFSYYLIEKPILKLKKRFSHVMSDDRVRSASA